MPLLTKKIVKEASERSQDLGEGITLSFSLKFLLPCVCFTFLFVADGCCLNVNFDYHSKKKNVNFD